MHHRVKRSDLDEEKWNACVQGSAGFRHYYLIPYLDGVCEEWEAIVDSSYKWVWPLPIKRFPVKQVYQPLLAQQLGPIGEFPSDNEISQIIEELSQEFKVVSVKFNDHYQDLDHCKHLSTHRNIELDLSPNYEELTKGYNRNIKSNLKRFEKSGLSVAKHNEFDDWALRTFKESKGKSLPELNEEFYGHVQSIYKNFKALGQASTYMVYNKLGAPMAQLMVLTAHNRLLVLFTASAEEARDCGAMHAIFDHVIAENSGGNNVLDFEGSNDDKLAYFYKSFGGVEKIYLQCRNSKLIWPFNRLINS